MIESDVRRRLQPSDRFAVHRRLTPLLPPPFSAQFYATEAGRQHFADQLTSIRYCVQETCSARGASNHSCAVGHSLALCAQTLIRSMRI